MESKIQHKKLNFETEIDSQKTDLWLPKGKKDKGGMDWEFGISRCKLFYIAWINSKVRLYSAGNYIQYPVINHKGKYMKKNILTYV